MAGTTKRNVKDAALYVMYNSSWVKVPVLELPTQADEFVEEEEATDFGDEYKDRLPTIKDRELLTIKVRDNGDEDQTNALTGVKVGCVADFRIAYTFSDRQCHEGSTPPPGSVISRDKKFTGYVQRRNSDTVTVDGDRVAAINLTIRPRSAFTDYTNP